MESEESERWREAIEKEKASLQQLKVWRECEVKKGEKVVDTKWVFKLKYLPNGEVDKYKARLVAKGFSQIQGVNYFDTYSPVVAMDSIRYLINHALNNNLEIHHIDIDTAFLHSPLTEDVFIRLPDGFDGEGGRRVVKLDKAIYGLKQSSKCLHDDIHSLLVGAGWSQSNADPCVFSKGESIISVYVDDNFIFAKPDQLQPIKDLFRSRYSITDNGNLTNLLGIRVTRTKDTITLDQSFYTSRILTRFDMHTCKPIATPRQANDHHATKDQSPFEDKVTYRSLVGSLMYLSSSTRPDISYSVSLIAQKVESPTQQDWSDAKRILRYLQGTLDFGIRYTKSNQQLVGFSDASYAEEEGRRSQSGYAFVVNGGAVSWRSKKQSCVATSSMEAELIALAAASKEALWFKKFEFLEQSQAIRIWEDNQSTIKFSENFVLNDRTKHISVRYYFIRDEIEKRKLSIAYCPTAQMTADILTKSLSRVLHERHRANLGMVNLRS